MSVEKPTVSVVVTCYNYGAYVQGALDSILAQTYDDYEIVLIDDGSTDDTPQKVEPYLKHERLRYLPQENAGQPKAKNAGVKAARGEFIAFLDADDLWEPEKLEKTLALFSRPEIGVTFNMVGRIDPAGKKLGVANFRDKYLMPHRGNVTGFLMFNNFVPFSASVVRKECFDELGGFDESLPMGIDWDLWLRFSSKYWFDYTDEILSWYRTGHPGQMIKNVEGRVKCSDLIMKRFIDAHPELFTKKLLRKVWGYAYRARGADMRGQDLKKSSAYFWKAIKLDWFHFGAYTGLLENYLIRVRQIVGI